MIISKLYSESLAVYYRKNSLIINKPYDEQYDHLLADITESVGLNTRIFNKLGIKTSCIITNATFLQEKWRDEHGLKSKNNKILVYEQVKLFKPEVLWIEDFDFINKDWLDLVRNSVPSIRIIISSHCAPYDLKMLNDLRNLDFIFTCTPGFRSDMEKHGIKAFLIYHAFNPDILDTIDDENPFPENNFVFSGSLYMGSGYHDMRIGLIEDILNANVDLKLYGNLDKGYKIKAKQSIYHAAKLLNFIGLGKLAVKSSLLNKYMKYADTPIRNYSERLIDSMQPPVFGFDMYKLLRKSKMILNMHGKAANEYAGNVRLFEATGLGSCLVTDNKNNLSELFDVNNEIVVYNNSQDCIEKVQWLLNNEEERIRIAKAGQARTLKSHTTAKRCKLMIDIINDEMKKVNLPAC
jgi:spore maturation protein CgeB